MNLYKLRHLHGFRDTREKDNIVVENGSLKPRKTTGTYKNFGKTVNEVWSEAFLNYMLVINILFGIPELSAALLLFYRQIMTLARSYDWLKGVFLLALGWHKYVVIRFSLDPSNWKIEHDYRVSYCNDVTVRSSIISKNLSSALLDPITINIRFRDDLTLGRVEKVTGD